MIILDLENIYKDTTFDLIALQIMILQAFLCFGIMAALTPSVNARLVIETFKNHFLTKKHKYFKE